MPRRLALVIEDSDDPRELYALTLQLDGYVVARAGDGRDGLQQARDRLPDVIITDLGMPIMDGWEMARRLRADPCTRHIRSSPAARTTLGIGRTPRRWM